MRRLGTVRFLACIGLLVAGTATAPAHHSFAMFDGEKCVILSGTVVKYAPGYPHVWLWVEVMKAGGTNETWGFEGADPSSLRLRGWSNALLKKGDKVDVAFNPIRDGRPGGSMKQVRLGSGQVLLGPGGPFPGKLKDCDFTNPQSAPAAKQAGE